MHIWLNNTESFLIAAVLVIIHPILGVATATFTSIFSGQLLASWLASYCSTAHFIYGNIETQAYIILWLAVAQTYYGQRGCSDLMCRWMTTLVQTLRILVYAFVIFLVLAVVEVAEVSVFG